MNALRTERKEEERQSTQKVQEEIPKTERTSVASDGDITVEVSETKTTPHTLTPPHTHEADVGALTRPKGMKKVESSESFVRPPLPPQRVHCPVPPPRKTKMTQRTPQISTKNEQQDLLQRTWDPKLAKFKYPQRPKNS